MIQCHTLGMLGIIAFADGRPDATDHVDHADLPIRCHHSNNAERDKCDVVLESLELAWQAQIVEGGWPEPFPDGGVGGSDALDVYFSSDAEGGAYVNSGYIDADPGDGKLAGASFMVLDPSLGARVLPFYLAHEFNHVLQFATDMSESALLPWEGSAVWAEEQTYPGQGSTWDYAPDFQAVPWAAITTDGYALWDDYEIWSYYEYGSALWIEWLFQEYGVEPVDIWLASVNETWANEPDHLDGVVALTGDLHTTWAAFMAFRGRVGTDNAPAWARDQPDSQVPLEGAIGVGDSLTPERLFDLGMVYVQIDAPGVLHVDGDSAIDWVLVSVDTGAVLTPPVDVEPGLVALSSLGGAAFDWDRTAADHTVALRLEPPTPQDTGDTGDPDSGIDTGDPVVGDPDEPRGRCSTAPGAAFWLLGVGALALRRRQGSARR